MPLTVLKMNRPELLIILKSASLNYIKKDAKFEYRIQANKLLNTRSRLNNSF
jgi:hypothetical protein